MISHATHVNGELSMKVCIDREGAVKYAHILEDETTIDDIEMRRNTLKALSNYQYERSIQI